MYYNIFRSAEAVVVQVFSDEGLTEFISQTNYPAHRNLITFNEFDFRILKGQFTPQIPYVNTFIGGTRITPNRESLILALLDADMI